MYEWKRSSLPGVPEELSHHKYVQEEFLDEKGHILAFLAGAHGGSSVFRYQYSPLVDTLRT
jgi:hypothetical protein